MVLHDGILQCTVLGKQQTMSEKYLQKVVAMSSSPLCFTRNTPEKTIL